MSKAYDLVIRGGTLADGTGGALREADVAVRDGRIVQVGRFEGAGTEEIDARGLLVTPGFVDIHTHYDAQVTWDERFAPSSDHGVTTVLMSNCGIGFAPCRTEQRELLMKLMEGVEDIPAHVMAQGIPWQWESFPEFMDYLAAQKRDLDFAIQVPHAPVRVYVMGRRGAEREPATDVDIQHMSRIVREAMISGAYGFSTSRTMNHRLKDGTLAPTITVAEEELRALALAVRESGRGVLQMVDDFHATTEEDSAEFAMWERLVEVSGRPMSFSLTQSNAAPERWRSLLRLVERANARGHAIKGQVCARAVGSLYGLELSNHPFTGCPSYERIAALPLAARLIEMRRPATRARILAEEPVGLPQRRMKSNRAVADIFEFGDPPDYCPPAERTLERRARELGVSGLELAYDLLVQGDGNTLFYYPAANYVDRNFDAVRTMMDHPDSILALGDGGAHVARTCDASLPTFILAYWTRDRTGERMPLATAVRRLSRETAELVGMTDRGLVAPGCVADLNVIDYDRLALHAPRPVKDLPTGATRLSQKATGYVATVKTGEVIYRDGTPTGALPGRLLRSHD
jgi:N-acyl-D-amino-acid deacylase